MDDPNINPDKGYEMKDLNPDEDSDKETEQENRWKYYRETIFTNPAYEKEDEDPIDNLSDLNLEEEEEKNISIQLEKEENPGPNKDEDFFSKVIKEEKTETPRKITIGKKRFLKTEFGITINKSTGIASKALYDMIKIQRRDDKSIKSVTFDDGLILVEKYDENKNKYILKWSDNRTNINNFKVAWNAAKDETNKSRKAIYGGQLNFEEITLKINKDATLAMRNVGEKLYHQIKNSKNLTPEEVAELDGVFLKDWDYLFDNNDKKLINDNLKALEQEKHHWEQKAILEPSIDRDGAKSHEKELYKKIVKLINLKIDEVKTRLNEKPVSELGIKILETEAKASYLLWWDKIKQWVKDNPYKTGILATIAGYLLTIGGFVINILEGTKDVVIAGAQGIAKLGYLVMDLSKYAGPIIAAAGSLVSGALSALSTGIGYLAHNLWLLAVALIYPIYKKLKGGKTKPKTKRKKK